jgi:hypothetical protein
MLCSPHTLTKLVLKKFFCSFMSGNENIFWLHRLGQVENEIAKSHKNMGMHL